MSSTFSRRIRRGDRAACAIVVSVALAAWEGASRAADAPCSARSTDKVPAVVELYTSEGCNSCPAAEHWLGGFGGSRDVIALAFHVDYWDGLGWKDRFAQPAFTQRQAASQRTTGARFAYTPQVVVDGRDTPAWSGLTPATLAAGHATVAPVSLQLTAQSHALELTVTPSTSSPTRTAGYVAVVDDGLVSRPAAGENRGATLHEDGVVRELLPWAATTTAPQTFRFTSMSTPEAGATRRYVAVATTADGAHPLQAVALACVP